MDYWRALTMVLGWTVAALSPGPAHSLPASVKRVGTLDLHACGDRGAFCGRVDRPFDPAQVLPDRISIYFEFYPHVGKAPPKGTLVATEGGPGYPATGSRQDYLALFAPLMIDHDVVIMDNRGTGRSGAVECRSLQTADRWTVEAVAACGDSLGERAPLYSTAYAADDLAEILDALGARKIDLYGDSYGTYFEQVFAIRHPASLRSVVLDGAYPLRGKDYAWYPNYAPAMRDKFNLACARSPACAAVTGSSIEHIQPTLDRLRARPFRARAHDIDGRERQVDADAAQLAIVMYGGAPAFTSVRETDAAARAFTAGDTAPLLRLMAETATAVDSRDPGGDATQWSAGLAAAVMCQDPPQIFDMRLTPSERAADRDRVLAERRLTHPDSYAPFTIDEFRGMPLDYSFLDQCVAWPVSSPGRPASQIGVDASYPDIPVLIISGELDDLTSSADGAAVAATFKRGLQVTIANSFHVNALPHARSACGGQIVRRFLATTRPGNIDCAARVPAVRLVPRFATEARELDAAIALPGNQASDAQLRLVAAAVLTIGDILARVPDNSSGQGVGLRGGTFRLQKRPLETTITLDRVKWVDDLAVSGRVTHGTAIPHTATRRLANRRLAPHRAVPADGKPADWVVAELRLELPSGLSGRLSAGWREDVTDPQTRVAGIVAGQKVAARTPAP